VKLTYNLDLGSLKSMEQTVRGPRARGGGKKKKNKGNGEEMIQKMSVGKTGGVSFKGQNTKLRLGSSGWGEESKGEWWEKKNRQKGVEKHFHSISEEKEILLATPRRYERRNRGK